MSGKASTSAQAIQALIDQAAHINVVSTPADDGEAVAVQGPGGIVGVRVRESLYRLLVSPTAPTESQPVRALNRVGERLGRFDHLWLVAPDDYVGRPGEMPPPTPLDPSRSQRLVMIDSNCTFDSGDGTGSGGDGFRGYGAGHTRPTTVGDTQRLLVNLVGTVTEGRGRFADHFEGTYLHCGELDPERGFQGNLLLRIMDPQGTLRSERTLPELRDRPSPEEGITYLLLRGEAVPSDPVSPKLGPDGRQIGLVVEQGLRLLSVDTSVGAPLGVACTTRIGQLVGRIRADVVFDPESAAGTLEDPLPFTVWDEFTFQDTEGRQVGRLIGDSSEGRVFNLSIGGSRAIRFGGVGRTLRGAGPFEGIDGLLTDNSVVVFEPHVSASVYVLRLFDPEGRFRAAAGGV